MTDRLPALNTTRANNFDALRCFFALAVIVHHMGVAFTDDLKLDPIWRAFHGRTDLGSIAVNAFFTISGFLITLSWMRTPRFGPYLRKRALRIFPGFLVVALLCQFVVAPLAGASLADVFNPIHAIANVAQLLVLSVPTANGTFTDLAIPSLNASLWTIRYEFYCYLLVPVFMLLSRYVGRWTVLLCFVVLLQIHRRAQPGASQPDAIPMIGDLVYAWPRLLTYYLAGMVFAQYRDWIPMRRSLAALSIAILLVTGPKTGGLHLAMPTVGVYLLLYVAFEPLLPLSRFGKYGDFSYGIYLYGWPVQQLVLHYAGPARLTPTTLFCITLPLVLLCAVMSWHFVEEPFLRRKAVKPLPEAPAPTPATVAQEGLLDDDAFEAVTPG